MHVDSHVDSQLMLVFSRVCQVHKICHTVDSRYSSSLKYGHLNNYTGHLAWQGLLAIIMFTAQNSP